MVSIRLPEFRADAANITRRLKKNGAPFSGKGLDVFGHVTRSLGEDIRVDFEQQR